MSYSEGSWVSMVLCADLMSFKSLLLSCTAAVVPYQQAMGDDVFHRAAKGYRQPLTQVALLNILKK